MRDLMLQALPAPLPEITERSADASIRLIYADIRRVTCLPIVNLIYRHLATREDVLTWAWSGLRPHFLSGAVAALAAELRARMPSITAGMHSTLPGPVEPHVDTTEAFEVVRVYNAGNSVNMVAITALLKAGLPGVGSATAAVPNTGTTRSAGLSLLPPLPPLPPLPDLQSLGPEMIERVLRLNTLADDPDPVIVASLYRHLALWPEVLIAVERLLDTAQQRALLLAARQATVAATQALLERQHMPMPPPVASFTEHFAATVEQFATVTIPKMLPIGALLQQAWQSDAWSPRSG